ncbi:hypothetical protein MLD38_032479 [Melastoma candidum]|uniref:Uncharacterized protein n=1 Tax=Melastoma candidum TaxID=119954 RepID=A0ACB9M5R7_9MYRT|nr:hypothetical protein MLD38_032479 [Melastoma candidum]
MSINHFSASFPESFWRPHPLHYDPVVGNPPKCQVTGFDFNLNNGHANGYDEPLPEGYEANRQNREPLFEKSLTPSDVGKLNRLVIPKQHAERCFPLGGLGLTGADSGMLLSFEDESGKCWRFRYSYWSSSQSYVLTKGWSRYIKEKMLDAGDVVFFQRHRVNGDRLFIGWRRRGAAAVETPGVGSGAVGGNGYPVGVPYASSDPDQGANHAGPAIVPGSASGNSRRFRLFGVNLEYSQQPDYDFHDEGSRRDDYSDTYPGNLYNYMDVNQIR